MTIVRPARTKERELIVQSSWRKFSPRLPDQPIFYPVTKQQFADMTARDWNVKHNDDHRRYVIRFEIKADAANICERQVVGERECEELWVSSEELPAFNAAIVGRIEVVAKFGA